MFYSCSSNKPSATCVSFHYRQSQHNEITMFMTNPECAFTVSLYSHTVQNISFVVRLASFLAFCMSDTYLLRECASVWESNIPEKAWNYRKGHISVQLAYRWCHACAGTSMPVWPLQHRIVPCSHQTSELVEFGTSGLHHSHTPSQRRVSPAKWNMHNTLLSKSKECISKVIMMSWRS